MHWYEVTDLTLVWNDLGMKWPWYEVHWYEVTIGMKWLVWSGLGMKCTGMKWPWYEVHWYEVALVWSALVWSDFDMKCRMVCSALVWSAWYEVTIFPFGMKWRKKWSAGWMKWLGTFLNNSKKTQFDCERFRLAWPSLTQVKPWVFKHHNLIPDFWPSLKKNEGNNAIYELLIYEDSSESKSLKD